MSNSQNKKIKKLWKICLNNKCNQIKQLLPKVGHDVEITEGIPLWVSIFTEDNIRPEVVEIFMKRNIDLFSFETKMHGNVFHILAQVPLEKPKHFEIVASHYPKETIQKLLNYPDVYGRTPLHDLANTGHAKLTELFIKYGADPKIRCDKEYTPFICSIMCGKSDVISYYIDYIKNTDNSILEEVDSKGNNILNCIMEQNLHLEIVPKLIDLGCDFMHKNNEGLTSIEQLAQQDAICLDCSFKILLNVLPLYFEKDMSLLDKCMELATKSGNVEIVQLILITALPNDPSFRRNAKRRSNKSPRYMQIYKLLMQCYSCREVPKNPDSMSFCVCKKAVYCNEECQKKDWHSQSEKSHKLFCDARIQKK